MITYKSDFEEERRDREAAHSKMADMEKKKAQLTGHEGATYKHEIYELKQDKQVLKEELHKKHKEIEKVTGDFWAIKADLKKYQTVLADLEIVHKKHVQAARTESKNLKQIAEDAMSDLQAKTSQVKQYAKENDALKKEIQKLKHQVIVLCEYRICSNIGATKN